MKMDWEAVRNVIMLLNFAGTIGIGVWAWLRAPSEANSKRLKEHDDELERLRRDIGDRLVTIESRLPFTPTVTELGPLHQAVAEVSASQDALQREVHGMRESIRRIEDFLLRSKT